MDYFIENTYLRATVNARGAELSSLYNRNTQAELLWQGSPAIWNGHSPLLFPIVGKLKDDQYQWEGKTYTMPKHGFAKSSLFTLSAQTADAITLTLTESAETFSGYPFAFALDVSFTLVGNRLEILHSVRNPSGTETLPFSIGAHPAFNCDIGDSLVFEHDEIPLAYRLDENFLLSQSPTSVPLKEKTLPITKDLFEKDALIFQNLRSRSAVLHRQKTGDTLRMDWFSAPVLGIWAKSGAPYVCVEPWYGIDDHAIVTGQLSKKPHIILLPPLQRFCFPVHITAL